MTAKKFKLRARDEKRVVREYFITIDEQDAHWLRNYTWTVRRGHLDGECAYPCRTSNGFAALGRTILGVRDPHIYVRYADGNPFNCTRANLRADKVGYEVREIE